ncbi:response regulator [Defluviimonas sp. SAOS-178_SWC]|uniref:response regulator n=1 Tax=Defluviimonas sp. SAOS-178_SWC TaxID=3121287 RepID=UPI003221F455
MTLLGHDLRAAVSDIIGGLRLIDQDGFDDATRLQLERIRASGEILARLLEQGLAMMLGEDDFAATHPANLQMARFLYDIEMRWSGRASEKGLDFKVSRSGDVPQVLTLDRIALERILSNILSNAVKYTDEGTVGLDICMADTGALRITVVDQGPGFSADALTRLFEFKGRPDGTGKPGQGLGMHITKSMAGRLGGTISVENLPTRGARVTLDLPPDTWTIAASEPIVELPDLSRTKVLVAEDNATNQTIIGHMLAKMGAQYEIAEDGVEALHWLERENFDLALIDIEMPRLSGIDVIRALRANDRLHSHMPIIAITAYVLRANRDAIYAAGADAILAKPLAGLETFGMAITNVLNRVNRPEEDQTVQADEMAEFDRASFDRLIDIAGPVASRELLERLCNDLRKTERGLVAGLADNDIAAIRAETHVLIALAGAVGAARLQALAQTLNVAAHRRERGDLSQLGRDALAQLDRLIHFVNQERARRGEAA